VALTAPLLPLPPGQPGIWFHEAMSAEQGRAPRVEVWLPAYRGKSLVPLLGWLVATRLASPDAEVTWWLEKRQGPGSVARMLTELGWRQITRERDGRRIRLTGLPPAAAAVRPDPACFTGRIGATDLTLAADYGVFSPKRIDDGTALLAEVALAEAALAEAALAGAPDTAAGGRAGPPADAVADIGVGYGALAVGLVASGLARRAVATDIDSVALWLAGQNARRHGVDLTVACTPVPTDVPPTALTVCNIPTHIDAAASASLMAGLARRATYGRLLIVVHQSLEQRYARHLTQAGLAVDRHPGPAHTVLSARPRP
jgi:16S rRNA G1207 methylase RsmC